MLDETGGPLTPDESAAARRVFSNDAAALAAYLTANAARNSDLSEDEAADIAVEEVRQVRRARRARRSSPMRVAAGADAQTRSCPAEAGHVLRVGRGANSRHRMLGSSPLPTRYELICAVPSDCKRRRAGFPRI